MIWQAFAEGRDKQMSRISREERLSELRCQLSSGKDGAAGKVVSLYDLRGFSRVVIVAGDAAYWQGALLVEYRCTRAHQGLTLFYFTAQTEPFCVLRSPNISHKRCLR
jgi:hypothetical protein